MKIETLHDIIKTEMYAGKDDATMSFCPPIPLIRRNLIIKKLRKCGALSPETAKTLAQAGVLNPDAFKRITDKLVQKGTICQTPDGKYFLPR